MTERTANFDACPSFRPHLPCEPPEWEWLSLSEALTWIAFENPMDSQRLSGLLDRVSAPEETAARAQLRAAAHRLIELGRKGMIQMTGKFTNSPDESFATSKRRLIPAREFKEYKKYEADFDGLRRWLGHAIDCTSEPGTEMVCNEIYLSVEVKRAELIAKCRPTTQMPNATSRPTVNADRECEQWLVAAFAADPDQKKSKPIFKAEAVHAFNGRLSVRGFQRAWARVAPARGRSRPGRKS